MKIKFSKSRYILFHLATFAILSYTLFSSSITARNEDFRNFYGICWRGTPHENLLYARHMGYNYVFYQKDMELDSLSNGLHFYLETPEYAIYNRSFNLLKKYSKKEIKSYEFYYALKRTKKSFPENLATGWHFSNSSVTPLLDFQQQKIISWAIDSILRYVKKIETRNTKFHFGGFAWDVPQPQGDFWGYENNRLQQVTLKHWNGGDFGMKKRGITYDYTTYSDGRINFYKQLFKRTKVTYPTARFIMEPYRIYEDWISIIQNRSDAESLNPDILAQESSGNQFCLDPRIFKNGLINKANVACTTPNVFSEKENRELAALAAINGSTFAWYGRFGGTGNMPNYMSIREVPPRLKLIRVLTSWENQNKTPLNKRRWDGNKYTSPTAFVDSNVISLLQPKTNNLFIVFLTPQGIISIPKGKKILSIYKTDDLFIESAIVNSQVEITNDSLSLKPANAEIINKCYIAKLK